MHKKNIALVLSGCGHRDGSEITEAVSAWIALSERGAQVQAFAPDRAFTAVSHLTGEPLGARQIMDEAARIARGKIKSLLIFAAHSGASDGKGPRTKNSASACNSHCMRWQHNR